MTTKTKAARTFALVDLVGHWADADLALDRSHGGYVPSAAALKQRYRNSQKDAVRAVGSRLFGDRWADDGSKLGEFRAGFYVQVRDLSQRDITALGEVLDALGFAMRHENGGTLKVYWDKRYDRAVDQQLAEYIEHLANKGSAGCRAVLA